MWNPRWSLPTSDPFDVQELSKRGCRKAQKMKVGTWIVALACAVAAAASVTEGAMAQDAVKTRSVWSGVYTTAQAKRGETLYSAACSHCHGARLNGAAAA